jgi:hypothetical protein
MGKTTKYFIAILTILLNKSGTLFVPYFNPDGYVIKSVPSDYNNIQQCLDEFGSRYKFEDDKIIINDDYDNVIIPSFKIRYNSKVYSVEDSEIHKHNFKIFNELGFSVSNEMKIKYPIKNFEFLDDLKKYYIFNNSKINFLNLHPGTLLKTSEIYLFQNRPIKIFYNIKFKNKYLKYENSNPSSNIYEHKYLKYKYKYLQLKNKL